VKGGGGHVDETPDREDSGDGGKGKERAYDDDDDDDNVGLQREGSYSGGLEQAGSGAIGPEGVNDACPGGAVDPVSSEAFIKPGPPRGQDVCLLSGSHFLHLF
jgi:hypothetical protein